MPSRITRHFPPVIGFPFPLVGTVIINGSPYDLRNATMWFDIKLKRSDTTPIVSLNSVSDPTYFTFPDPPGGTDPAKQYGGYSVSIPWSELASIIVPEQKYWVAMAISYADGRAFPIVADQVLWEENINPMTVPGP